MRPDEPVLGNPRSDRARRLRGLSGRSVRRRSGTYRVEGAQAVRELLRHRVELVRELYATPEFCAAHPDVAALIREASATPGVRAFTATDAFIAGATGDAADEEAVVGHTRPQGVLAVAAVETRSLADVLADVAAHRSGSVDAAVPGSVDASAPGSARPGERENVSSTPATPSVPATPSTPAAPSAPATPSALTSSSVPASASAHTPVVAVLAGLRDPGNAGTVLRAADAAGADAVVLSTGSVDVTSPKVQRSAAGSQFHLPVVTGVPAAEALATLRDAGLTLLATSPRGRVGLYDLPPADGGVAWIFGNEAHGLPDDLLSAADETVAIPMRGRAESLNLAMAATLCLFESARPR